LTPPAAVNPPISTASTTPAPPGVNGMAVARRANANTARTSAQPTSASETPTWRRETSSTAYSDTWLTRDVTVIGTQPCSSRSMVRVRNFTVASSQPCTGGRRTSRSAQEAAAPASSPTRRATCSLRSIRAKITTAAIRAAIPSRAAVTRPPPALPWSATSASASTGMPSLMKVFQTPDTSTAMVVRDREKPQVCSIV
jgi:hypothetical protein